MDKKKGLLNVIVSVLFRVLILVAEILVRRFLIRYIGNEVNGLNSLYVSILNVLSIAELGIGTAITFCMYKPIVEGDNDKVSALYHLFTKFHIVVAAIILVCGCALMPVLPYLAKGYREIDVNLYLTFGLMLASVIMTYVFSSKTSLINAYKNNYITTSITSFGHLLQGGLQIVVLVTTRSFVWFLAVRILAVGVQWGLTELIARLKHNTIIKNKQKVDDVTKKEVTKNVKALFMHKIGAMLVNTADSIIISAFIGIVILGKYSNYVTIMTSMTGVLALCFTPLTSVIGHMFAENEGNPDEAVKYFKFFHAFNFVLGAVFFLGYYAVINNLIVILFDGEDLLLGSAISFVITVNYFIQFMRHAALLFRDASGTFYNDRWKPLVEGVLNIVLSILFVLIFPKEYNVIGVIVATIITNLFICHVVEPYVLYKHAFKRSVKGYYVKNYVYILAFVAALVILHFSMVSIGNVWLQFLANGFIAVGIALVFCAVAILSNKEFRLRIKKLFRKKSKQK